MCGYDTRTRDSENKTRYQFQLILYRLYLSLVPISASKL